MNYPESSSGRSVAEADLSVQVLWCVDALKADMEREQKAVDQHVLLNEYGKAEYCKGREHAFAIASLRVKRLAAAAALRGLAWKWSEREQGWNLMQDGHSHATVWPNGTWHTWDADGVGGENSVCKYAEVMPFENRHFAAKREAWEACERQGFIAKRDDTPSQAPIEKTNGGIGCGA